MFTLFTPGSSDGCKPVDGNPEGLLRPGRRGKRGARSSLCTSFGAHDHEAHARPPSHSSPICRPLRRLYEASTLLAVSCALSYPAALKPPDNQTISSVSSQLICRRCKYKTVAQHQPSGQLTVKMSRIIVWYMEGSVCVCGGGVRARCRIRLILEPPPGPPRENARSSFVLPLSFMFIHQAPRKVAQTTRMRAAACSHAC